MLFVCCYIFEHDYLRTTSNMSDPTYWDRHVQFTIPPAIALTLLYRPFFTPRDVYRIVFLVTIALVYTTPWDAYLIAQRIWTYPEEAVCGLKLFGIPYEEVFFFVIQTYTTSLLYLFFSKLSFKPVYLRGETKDAKTSTLRIQKIIDQLLLAASIVYGAFQIKTGSEGTYLGLILAWAMPVCLFLWTMSSEMILQLPKICTVGPIVLPTFYLWIVDTIALRRGTWAIESGTKLGVCIWEGLEIEEAVFFFVTNLLIVFGLVCFDHTIAILESFPALFPRVPELPGLALAARALSTDPKKYDESRIVGIQEAVQVLKNKSRSFYLASSVFSGRLRIDLTLLYAFCRVADDLVDNATSEAEAADWIAKLKTYLDIAYSKNSASVVQTNSPSSDPEKTQQQSQLANHISSMFPPNTQSALTLLPTTLLSPQPLYDLLRGFEMDLCFPADASKSSDFPIANEVDLEEYAKCVAGTVAELCLELVFHHSPAGSKCTEEERKHLIKAGGRMGVALQYVNIARDFRVDSKIGRVYIPSAWLKEEGLTPSTFLGVMKSNDAKSMEIVSRLQSRMLDEAFKIYAEAKPALDRLPRDVRKPMKVAVESYMEIGRVLREQGVKGFQCGRGRATVPKKRRIGVAFRVLNGC